MAQNVSVNNFDSNNVLELAVLDADVAAAATSITLQNNQDFVDGSLVVLGPLGSETAELVRVTDNPSGNVTLQVSALKFAHSKFDPVTRIFGDQIRLYRAANTNAVAPADASFVQVGSNVDIDIDQLTTDIYDSSGGSDYWYRYTYFNSDSSSETILADSNVMRGGGVGDYCSLDDIRRQAGFTNARYITDAMIDEKRQAAQSTISGKLSGKYTVPFTTPINPLIKDMTIRLAAGWLLLQQYDRQSVTGAKGQAMVDSVMNADKTGDLDRLYSGDMVLVGTDGASTATGTSTTGFTGWPNDSTPVNQSFDGNGQPVSGSGDFKFRVNDQY